MYDFEGLEKKWITYKKNRYKKSIFLIGGFIAVSTLSSLVTYIIVSAQKVEQISKQPQQSMNNNTAIEKNDTLLTQQSNNMQPSQIMPKEIVIVSQNEDKSEQFKSLEQKPQGQSPQTQIVQPLQKKEEPKPAPKIHMETKIANATDSLKEQYYRQPSYSGALGLSSEYYKNGDFQKSLYWAINANSIDSKNEKSWIMFAKASYKLGRKTDAINALENFIRNSPSENAKAALTQIKNNEL